jgi:hypothetical protein
MVDGAGRCEWVCGRRVQGMGRESREARIRYTAKAAERRDLKSRLPKEVAALAEEIAESGPEGAGPLQGLHLAEVLQVPFSTSDCGLTCDPASSSKHWARPPPLTRSKGPPSHSRPAGQLSRLSADIGTQSGQASRGR